MEKQWRDLGTPSEDSCDEVVESSDNEGICQGGGSAYGDTVECCNKSCAVIWFHLHCMSLATALKVIGIVVVNVIRKLKCHCQLSSVINSSVDVSSADLAHLRTYT